MKTNVKWVANLLMKGKCGVNIDNIAYVTRKKLSVTFRFPLSLSPTISVSLFWMKAQVTAMSQVLSNCQLFDNQYRQRPRRFIFVSMME